MMHEKELLELEEVTRNVASISDIDANSTYMKKSREDSHLNSKDPEDPEDLKGGKVRPRVTS